MNKRKILTSISLMMAVFAIFWSVNNTLAANAKTTPGQDKKSKVTQADRQAAARALQKGAINPLMVEMQAALLKVEIDDIAIICLHHSH